MGELYNPFPRLPKNIRQIGNKDEQVKLYVEDYVNTYLNRLYPAGGQDLRVGLLLGTAETCEGIPYLFIDGALEMENVTAAGEKVVFTEAAWKKAYQNIEESFPRRTVQGWFLCGSPGCILSPLNYWKQHSQYFGGKNQLMYINGGIDGEEALYVTSEDGFYKLKGYSVYYERNQMMQDYMIHRKDVRRVESGGNDRVIRDFRSRMEEHRQEAASRRGTIRTLGTLCSVLSVAVLSGGVVMFNNYQRMQEMETVLASVLPEGVLQDAESGSLDPGLIVEEIKGQVYPLESESAAGSVQRVDGNKILESGRLVERETLPQAAEADKAEQDGNGTGGADRIGAGQDGGSGGSAGDRADESSGNSSDGSGTGQSSSGNGGSDESSDSGSGSGENGTSQNGSSNPAGDSEDGDEKEEEIPVTNYKPGDTYTIGEGETLYGICFKLYDSLDYLDDIRALNQLSDQDAIVAGRDLILPDLS